MGTIVFFKHRNANRLSSERRDFSFLIVLFYMAFARPCPNIDHLNL